jgi:uncharacterized protein (DUF885 family)
MAQFNTPGPNFMDTIRCLSRGALLASCALLVQACSDGGQTGTESTETGRTAQSAAVEAAEGTSVAAMAERVTRTADEYYAYALEHTPQVAYFSGVELPRHDGLYDNRPAAQQARDAVIDEWLSELESVDASALAGRTEWITHAYLMESLRSEVAQRVCRNELWNVNQMGGWHSGYQQIAERQPVGTAELRAQSLARWSKLPALIDQEIQNLERGLELG